MTQFTYPQALFSTTWKKGFWSLSPGLSRLILHWFQSNSQCTDTERARFGICYCSEEYPQNPFPPQSFRFTKSPLSSFMLFSSLPCCKQESDSPGREGWLVLLDGQGLHIFFFQHWSVFLTLLSVSPLLAYKSMQGLWFVIYSYISWHCLACAMFGFQQQFKLPVFAEFWFTLP